MRKRRPLYIKNPEAHRLAKRLSEEMGVSLTDAVIHALREEAEAKGRPANRAKVGAICEELDSLPIRDARTPNEILGYDKLGIPR